MNKKDIVAALVASGHEDLAKQLEEVSAACGKCGREGHNAATCGKSSSHDMKEKFERQRHGLGKEPKMGTPSKKKREKRKQAEDELARKYGLI